MVNFKIKNLSNVLQSLHLTGELVGTYGGYGAVIDRMGFVTGSFDFSYFFAIILKITNNNYII